MFNNNVTLLGRVAGKPMTGNINNQNGKQSMYAHYSIAVDRPVRSNNNNQNRQTADFIDVTLFGIPSYIKQEVSMTPTGTKVGLSGVIRTSSYTSKKTGQKVYRTGIIANSFRVIETKAERQAREANKSNSNNAANAQRPNVPDNGDLPF